jgi:hypothetical protein
MAEEKLPEAIMEYQLNAIFKAVGLPFTGSTTYQEWSLVNVVTTTFSITYSTTFLNIKVSTTIYGNGVFNIISPSSYYDISETVIATDGISTTSTTLSTTTLTLDPRLGYSISIYYKYNSVIEMLENILKFNGIPAQYMAEVKNLQVRTNNPSAVFVMDEVKPVLYWHNWADEYNFTLQIYALKPSVGPSAGFGVYDEIVKRDIMYDIINSKLTTGGTVIGYNAVSNWLAMKQKRGITYVEYKIKILVVYSS